MKAIVSEPRPDLPPLRLRAFEIDWVRPLLEGARGRLDAMLIIEAGYWIRVGQSLGYFATVPLLTDALPLPDFGTERGHDLATVEDFVLCLDDALEDLTPARRAFLETMLFSAEAAFQKRVTRLEEVARAFAAGPDAQLASRALDDAAGGLEGATSSLEAWAVTHPASWRSSNVALAQSSDRARERIAQVERVRGQISSSVMGRLAPELRDEDQRQPAVPVTTDDQSGLRVTLLTLGIETLGGIATPLVPRGTAVPTESTEVFSTAEDNQSTVQVHVLLGERPMADANVSLGKFTLANIPPAPRGVPQIEVTFRVARDGTLHASARDQQSGARQDVHFSAGRLSTADVEAHMLEAELQERSDLGQRELAEARNEARAMLARAALAQGAQNPRVPPKPKVTVAAELLRQSLALADEKTLRKLTGELQAALGQSPNLVVSELRLEAGEWMSLEERSERKFEGT